MILTPHILAGAVIGSKVASPAAVFILSFLSHYFLEIFPHYEYKLGDLEIKKKGSAINKRTAIILMKVFFDFAFGLILALYLVSHKPYLSMSLAGMLTAVIPDGLLFLYWQNPRNIFLKFFALPHRFLHFLKNKSPVWLGLIVEIVIGFLLILLLL